MPRKTAAAQEFADVLLPGFNEAAARCRGKQLVAGKVGGSRARFNEAAARCRGKRTRATAASTRGSVLQ